MTVISIILLATVPNIAQKRRIINDIGCDALIEIVNGQILLYQLQHGTSPSSVHELIEEGYLNPGQDSCPDGRGIDIHGGQASAH